MVSTLMEHIIKEKVKKYFTITKEALAVAKASGNRTSLTKEREEFLDMVERYVSDAEHFEAKGDLPNAFAALSYAHGWLDAGATIGIFDVHDSRLFTVD